MYNKIIITATNDKFFDSLMVLISSIHKYSFNIVDQIFVYNIGLSEEHIDILLTIKKITVLNFSEEAKNSHIKFMEPKQFVYKAYCLNDASRLGINILWIDSGAMFLRSCGTIFDTIQNEHIFIVGDIYHKNKNHIHDKCISIMQASQIELDDSHIWAGLIGYKYLGKYQYIIDEHIRYAMIPGCCDRYDINCNSHLGDQSILCILVSRYKAPRHSLDMYGYWHYPELSRNIQDAININSYVLTHRGRDDNILKEFNKDIILISQ